MAVTTLGSIATGIFGVSSATGTVFGGTDVARTGMGLGGGRAFGTGAAEAAAAT